MEGMQIIIESVCIPPFTHPRNFSRFSPLSLDAAILNCVFFFSFFGVKNRFSITVFKTVISTILGIEIPAGEGREVQGHRIQF